MNDELKKAIEADKQERQKRCMDAITAALNECGCELVPVATFRGGQMAQSVEIVAK